MSEREPLLVWKFPLLWGEVGVSMPKGAKVVHVGRDPAGEYVAVWALVNPSAESETRTFAVVGTGHAVPQVSIHVGSLIDGDFVWHVFETTPERVLMASFAALR